MSADAEPPQPLVRSNHACNEAQADSFSSILKYVTFHSEFNIQCIRMKGFRHDTARVAGGHA